MAESDPSTRVDAGSWKRPVVGHMAHGPDKAWERVGLRVTVSVTIPPQLLRAARARRINLSGTLEETLDRLVGDSDLGKAREELRTLDERRRIVEAAIARLEEQRRVKDDAATLEKARHEAIRELAAVFAADEVREGHVVLHRPSLGKAAPNLNWIEGQARRRPALRGMKPAEILDLVLQSTTDASKEGKT